MAQHKEMFFCTKFGDLNLGVALYKGCTVHLVMRQYFRTKSNHVPGTHSGGTYPVSRLCGRLKAVLATSTTDW